MRNRRERFICSTFRPVIRHLIALLALASTALPALAVSVQEFDAKPTSEQAAFLVGFIEKMTSDLWTKNPHMAKKIRDWFGIKADSKPTSEGLHNLVVELTALEYRAREGKVDLSKIQIEGVVVKVVKDKFPPPQPPVASPPASLPPFEARDVIDQLDYLLRLEQNLLANPTVSTFEAWLPVEQIASLTKVVRETRDSYVRNSPEDAEGFTNLFEGIFAVSQPQVSSAGIEQVNAQLAGLNTLAQQGKADLSAIRMRSVVDDVLLGAIDAKQEQLRQRLKEIEDNAIKLHDGRRVYIDGDGFRDESGAFLEELTLRLVVESRRPKG
jgi:hypothetical protein